MCFEKKRKSALSYMTIQRYRLTRHFRKTRHASGTEQPEAPDVVDVDVKQNSKRRA